MFYFGVILNFSENAYSFCANFLMIRNQHRYTVTVKVITRPTRVYVYRHPINTWLRLSIGIEYKRCQSRPHLRALVDQEHTYDMQWQLCQIIHNL